MKGGAFGAAFVALGMLVVDEGHSMADIFPA